MADEQSRAPEYASRAVLTLRIYRAYPVTRADNHSVSLETMGFSLLLRISDLGYNGALEAAMTLESMINSLSHDEKLLAMELLWRDLSRRPADVPSPEWHGEVLAQRMAAVREGATQFVDWADAKKRLRDRLE